MFRTPFVPRTVDRAFTVLFHPTVFGRERRRVLLGDAAETHQPRPQRIPLHHGAGRDQAGRVGAGVRAHQEIWPPVAGRRLGRGHVLVTAMPGRFDPRHDWRARKRSSRCSRSSGSCPSGCQSDARSVDRVVHGVRQHRPGTVAVDHVGRGEKSFQFFVRS